MEEKMDTGTIEKFGVIYLQQCLLKCGKIDPDINTNDKTVSWDGDIYLYSDESKKKDYLIGKCNVQVKSHSCVCLEDLNKPTIKFEVNCADLKNYINDGGVIYFVVYLSDNGSKYTIYYNSLLPYDINKILKDTREAQKTKNVEFEKFPEEEYDIEQVIKEFIFHRRLQYSTYNSNPLIFPLNGKEQYQIWFDINKPLLSDTRRYVYRKICDGIYAPVFKCSFTGLELNGKNLDVSIDGVTYFRNVQLTLVKNDEIKKIILNHGLNITGFGNRRCKIQLKKNCNIAEYIQNIKFMIAMKNGFELKIGNIACGSSFEIFDENNDLEYELDVFQKIEKLLSTLKVDKQVMVSKLSSKMIDDLLTLYSFIVLKEYHLLIDGKSENNVGKVTVGDYNFFLIKLYNENNEAIIVNPFEDHLQCEMSHDGGDRFASSLALLLSQKEYDLFDNINYEAVRKSVTELPYCDDLDEVVLRTILSLLSRYDKTSSEEILECVTDIAEWLYNNNDSMINKLNYLQCVYRNGGLKKSDIDSLIESKNKNYAEDILTGINILLNYKEEFNYHFYKMSKKEQELFVNYPIYNLVKDMN